MPALLLFSLLAAAEQPIDTFASLDAWQVNQDGSEDIAFRPETELVASPPGALRIAYGAGGRNKWGNLRRNVSVPPDAVAVTFKLRVLQAEPGAAMHVWFLEADGDGYLVRVTVDGHGVDELAHDTWHTVRLPLGLFHFDPRGNKQRGFLTIDRILLGNNYAPLEVIVDDLAFELVAPRAAAPLPRSQAMVVADGPQGRVALLDEPGLPQSNGCPDLTEVSDALAAAGYGVTRLRAGDLVDPAVLSRDRFDLLLLPCAPAFPAAACEALKSWLKSGGAFLSVGGYAFDRLVDWTGEGWVDLGSERRASEMDSAKETPQLNTRSGTPGDTMRLEPDQIGLFDPSYLFEQVDRCELGGKRLEGEVEGWVARTLAGLNSPVFPDQYGEVEHFGQAYDRLGRPRGALGVTAQFYAGPYAGAAWGGFGVTNRNLFASGAMGMGPLVDMAGKLVARTFLCELSATPACVRDGEPVELAVHARNDGRLPRHVRVQVALEGETVLDREVDLQPGADAALQATWRLDHYPQDLYHVTATMESDGRTVMTRETAFCAWQPAAIASGPRVRWQGNYLEVDGTRRFLTGTNQTGVMWFTPREDPLTWDRDFQQMADHGIVVWRVLHFSPIATRDGVTPSQNPLLLGDRPPEEMIRKTDAVVQLAQKHGVVPMICAHDWIGVAIPDDQLEAQRTWNRFWAERYKDVPGLIWDIQNEPSVSWGNPAPGYIGDLWASFLAERFGDLATARAALGIGPDEALVPAPGDGSWGDLRSAMLERFRTWLLQRWVRANVAGLREGDPDAVVTVGYLQDRHSADKVNGAEQLDFANMHSYESPRTLASSLRFIDRRAEGKGLSLGEFGSRQSHDARVNGQTGDRRELDAARFETTVAQTFGLGGAFASNWCWRDLPDVIFPWGLFKADRTPRPWVAEYLAWTLATRGVEPLYEAPEVYLLLPDENRLGARFGEIDGALSRCLDVVSGLHVPFAVLHEWALERVPEEAKALLWPLPYCPADATFEAVRRWVEAGGSLYLSGDLTFDELRRPTKTARLAALGLPERPSHDPFTPAGDAAPVASTVGAGKVTWLPQAAELGAAERLRPTYLRFLADAGVRRLAVEPDLHDVQVDVVPGAAGSRAVVVVSWGAAREVAVGGPPEVKLSVGQDRAGFAQLGADGQVLGLLSHGPASVGGPVFAQASAALAISLDGADLRDAKALAVLPLAPGELVLATRHAWSAPAASVGGVEQGSWHELERLVPTLADGRLTLRLAPVHVGTLLVVSEPADQDAAAPALLNRLSLRPGGD